MLPICLFKRILKKWISTSLALTWAITGRSGTLLIMNLREGGSVSWSGVLLRHFVEARDHTVTWPVGALAIHYRED